MRNSPKKEGLVQEGDRSTWKYRCLKCRTELFPTAEKLAKHEAVCEGKVRIDLPPAPPAPPPPEPEPELTPAERLEKMKNNYGGTTVDSYLERHKTVRTFNELEEEEEEKEQLRPPSGKVDEEGRSKLSGIRNKLHWLHTSFR